jgi:DNA-binding response OmpR family regulator
MQRCGDLRTAAQVQAIAGATMSRLDDMTLASKAQPDKAIRIVLVEDDDIFRELIEVNLSKRGYQVAGVRDGAALYRELIERPADIIVLDVDLPGDNGLLIASHLRAMQRTRLYGIIMLTSDSNIQTRLDGLDSGADVFLTKPTTPLEINAHIQSLYRRLTLNLQSHDQRPWRFSRNSWKLIAPSGADIVLTHLETLLLDILADSPGRPVRRKDIIATALQQDPLAYDERRLEAVVSRLRRKIAKSYTASQPIKVAHSVGYIFADPIERE